MNIKLDASARSRSRKTSAEKETRKKNERGASAREIILPADLHVYCDESARAIKSFTHQVCKKLTTGVVANFCELKVGEHERIRLFGRQICVSEVAS